MDSLIHWISAWLELVTKTRTKPVTLFGCALAVRQSQCGAPGPPGYQPLFDAQVLTEVFQVGNHRLGRERGQVEAWLGGQGAAAPASPLVQPDDQPSFRIRRPAVAARPQPGTGAAVEPHHGCAVRIAAGLPIDLGPVLHSKQTRIERLDSFRRHTTGGYRHTDTQF